MASPPDGRSGGRDAERRGRNKPKDYVIERRGGVEELAEYRRDDPRPFRAPKNVFDTVVAVLAAAAAPLHAEEVEREVGRRLKDSVPNYVVRLCLRWLTSDQVRLAERVRARYAAKEPKKFRQAAAAAWAALVKRG